MSISKVVTIGLTGNEVSKKITGTHKVSAGRTAIATGSGAVVGAVAQGAIVLGATAIGVSSAPIAIPLAVGGAVVAGIASLFD